MVLTFMQEVKTLGDNMYLNVLSVVQDTALDLSPVEAHM